MPKEKNSDRKYYLFALKIVGEFSYLIAVPIVLLALLGNWLDKRQGTSPIFLIAGFILAALLSGFAVYRRVKEVGRQYRELTEGINTEQITKPRL